MRILIAAIIPILFACGKANDTAKSVDQNVNANEIMHTWQTKCSGNDLMGLSSQRTYQFSGNKAYREIDFYSTSSCNTPPTATVKYSGDLDVQEDSAAAKGARNIHIRWLTVNANATDESGKKLLSVFPIMKLPADEYNVVQADPVNKVLYFGDSTPTIDLSVPTRRPAKLDDKSPFFQVDKSIEN